MNELISDYEVIAAQYTGALSQPETLTLKILSSQSSAEIGAALNQRVEVLIKNAEQSWHFTLHLFTVEPFIATELMRRNCFLLTLRSPLYALTHAKLAPVLKNVSLNQVCDLLLSGRLSYKVGRKLQPYRFEVEKTNIEQQCPILMGLNESPYSFLTRILHFYGLSYTFDHTDQGMMVISDHLARYGSEISVLENTYASGELLTTPYYEQTQSEQSASVRTVLAAGHPLAEPDVLISSINKHDRRDALYQINYEEFNEAAANQHALWALQARQGLAERSRHMGGGILFPGMITQFAADPTRALLVETQFTLEFDAHEQDRVRTVALTAISQPLNFPYRDEPLLETKTTLLHGGTISDQAGATSASLSVSSEGHYHLLLPDFVTDNYPAAPVMDTRMVYPMQSDDHSQHFTLMNNAEGLLLYNPSALGESLLFGTGNSSGAGHITQEDSAQNVYWQDASENKTAFINEGAFDRTQATGRKNAYLMETPNYEPNGASSYARMGDPIQQDAGYASQAAESGLFMATTGHYHETHQGGALQLLGNAGDDPNNPVPIQRTMTQPCPIGTPHILQTSTADLHQDLKTAQNVGHSSELTAGTLTESLAAPTLFNTWSADNTQQIFVNQNLQQTKATRDINLNTHTANFTATNHNLQQNGALRTDQFNTHTTTRAHQQNLEQYESYQKSVTQSQTQINTQSLNVQNYTETAQTATLQTNQLELTAQTFNLNANVFQAEALVMSGSAADAGPSALEQAHLAKMAKFKQQSAAQKSQIAFAWDDPDNLIQLVPELCPSLTLQKNR